MYFHNVVEVLGIETCNANKTMFIIFDILKGSLYVQLCIELASHYTSGLTVVVINAVLAPRYMLAPFTE